MSKYKIFIKFLSLDKAKKHLQVEGFRYSESYSFKEDRCLLYKKGRTTVMLSSGFEYFNDNTMDMGTVWTLKSL